MSERGDQPRDDGQPVSQAQGAPTQGGAPQGEYAGQAAVAQESPIDIIQRPGPQQYLKGTVGLMAAFGVLLGVGAYLLGAVGGFSILPSAIQDVQSLVSGQQAQALNEAITKTHEGFLAYFTNELAPFLGFLLAPLIGVVVGTNMEDSKRAKLTTAGASVFTGTVVFVVILGFFASLLVPEVPQSAADSVAGGVSSMVSTDAGSLNYGTLITNAIVVAIPAGLAAASTTYFYDEYF